MSHGIPFFVFIIVSAVATIVVRLIPYYLSGTDHMPPYLKRCMRLLPVAAIGALIFPGVVTDFGTQWYAGIAGILAAALLGLKKLPMIASIVTSIIVTYLVLLI
ncbi:MAG: AzlD domain-containing protein [Sphaerochaetaceae bacterium]|jgi:branched-subunit amino acid transport protein